MVCRVLTLILSRVDESGQPVRGTDGLCIKCQPGETVRFFTIPKLYFLGSQNRISLQGEFVGKIVQNHPSRGFDGYVDKTATDQKIIGDVLRRGDSYFRSGDLLYADEFGWMYFVDRMGDTFRWRGENVSTVEVESAISSALRQAASVVYGVDIPGVEGKAGYGSSVLFFLLSACSLPLLGKPYSQLIKTTPYNFLLLPTTPCYSLLYCPDPYSLTGWLP